MKKILFIPEKIKIADSYGWVVLRLEYDLYKEEFKWNPLSWAVSRTRTIAIKRACTSDRMIFINSKYLKWETALKYKYVMCIKLNISEGILVDDKIIFRKL